ncbi:bifunctional phosphopantothenoylcysteine decarboxylase/phosphopantothenate--cysteine ligase CoaBC, partial [bacterium]|nr:bifunctional phosphopantothenoylcysteine decarboxylase/phosphopantothenate--cysteine ligase CoaBC [bacterium]
SGKKILITSGPTREFIDPVRFISNPSTGRMGIAIARAAKKAGADVTLILGPTEVQTPTDICLIRIVSAFEMDYAVNSVAPESDIIIMAAAVSDYTPIEKSEQKIKKTKSNISLQLKRTKDIISRLHDKYPDKFIVGFAAESENLVENAMKKLEAKKLDMIIANDITKKDAGFAADTNSVVIIDKSGNIEETGLLTKSQLAELIISKL